jgi:hypothetical protein
MKTMKKFWLVFAVVVLALALGASGLLASTITFNGDHDFYITVYDETGAAYLIPSSGTITTGVSGYADYNPLESGNLGNGPTAINVGSSSSVSATNPGGTWLQNRTTTTTYSGPLGGGEYGGTISRGFTSYGPDPNGHLNGDVGQKNSNTGGSATQLLQLVYTIPTTGNYLINFQDTYDLIANLVQGTGSSFPVSYFHGYSALEVTITNGSHSDNLVQIYNKTYGTLGSSTAIPDFNNDKLGITFALGPFTYDMNAGDTLTLDVSLNSYYDAQTMVPLPSTLLLLVSGLAGLGLLRFRRKAVL